MKESDIIIMIPVSGKLKAGERAKCKEADLYNDRMTSTAEYECDERFVRTIQRYSLDKVQVLYRSDDYDKELTKDYKNNKGNWIEGFTCYAYQEKSDLGIVQICISRCEKEDSQIGELVFSGHLTIKVDKNEYSIDEYLDELGLILSGKKGIIYTNSMKNKDAESIAYLLAGETKCSEAINYKILPDRIEKLTDNNISRYDFYDAYASSRSLVILLKGYCEDFHKNLEGEALLIYIFEVAMLQNAAISRNNNQIIDELMENSNISAKKTLKLQVEFGKTVMLWNNEIYKYYMAQEVSNAIVKAFGTDKLLKEYNRNSEHIQQIASLKSGITSEIEGKILNVLAFILSISQLVELIKQIIAYANGHLLEVVLPGSGGILIILLIILLRIRRISKKKKKPAAMKKR